MEAAMIDQAYAVSDSALLEVPGKPVLLANAECDPSDKLACQDTATEREQKALAREEARQREACAICDLIESKRMRTRVTKEMRRRHPRKPRPTKEIPEQIAFAQQRLAAATADLDDPAWIEPLKELRDRCNAELDRAIVRMSAEGHSQREIAESFGMTQQAIQQKLKKQAARKRLMRVGVASRG